MHVAYILLLHLMPFCQAYGMNGSNGVWWQPFSFFLGSFARSHSIGFVCVSADRIWINAGSPNLLPLAKNCLVSCSRLVRFGSDWHRATHASDLKRLTFPIVTPPLPDVDGLPCAKRPGLVVVRPLAHDRETIQAVEYDERELLQVDLMDLHEDLLPRAWIRRRLFLLVEGIQRMVAVEVPVGASGREQVTC